MLTGVEEGYSSNVSPDNPSRGRTSTDGGTGGKSMTYNSFGGMSGQADGAEGDQGRRLDEADEEDLDDDREDDDDDEDEEEEDEEEDDEEDDEDDDHDQDQEEDERHQGDVGNGGGRGGGGGGGGGGDEGYDLGHDYGDRNARDQADLERRSIAHAYADGLDSREAPQYPRASGDGAYGNADRHQRNSNNSAVMPPAPPTAGINGISPVDARAATALASRTRLAAGGVAVPDRSGVQRPEPGPVMAPGQAAAAAAAALRRGPTPGSHSLPSMVLVPLEALKAHRRVPRSSDRR